MTKGFRRQGGPCRHYRLAKTVDLDHRGTLLAELAQLRSENAFWWDLETITVVRNF